MIVHTLRGRFILSHILPLLVAVPLMGIALTFAVESQVLLPNVARTLSGQALLLADLAREQRAIWEDETRAQEFVRRMGAGRLGERLMLLDPAGRLLVSSDPDDQERVGRLLAPPGLSRVSAGTMSVVTSWSRRRSAEIVDVLAPVRSADGRVVGMVRLTLRLAGVTDVFVRLRYLVAGVLLAGVVLGGAVGWTLALVLARPLRAMTHAVSALAEGGRWATLETGGPEEIAVLSRSFNALVARLRELEDARRHLLANLVHELGRPLGAMRSAVQALERGAQDDAALRDELLSGIDNELQRLRRLVDDLARLHDRVLGTLELQRRPVAAAEWLSTAVAPWREAALQKGLRWSVTTPADLPVAEIDPDRAAQALGNLLSNAIKYTPSGGTVDVSAGLRGGSLWITVADSGPGIAPEERARLFEPFYRGPSSRRFPQGMGLGLTIAHDLAIAHGGRLEMESRPGQGSRFTLWLPLRPVAGPNDTRPSPPS